MASFKQIGKFDFSKHNKAYQVFKRKIPILISNEAENHFKQGFRTGGGKTDNSKTGWPQRQFTKGKGKRNILIGRGTLQKDIQPRQKQFRLTVIGTSSLTSKYASIHNEGGEIRITEKMRKYFWYMHNKAKSKAEKEYWRGLALHKGSKIKIPKREYIGDSKELEKNMENIIDKELLKVFK
jgi:phage gpG-like protein